MDVKGLAIRSHIQKHRIRIQKGRDPAPGPFCCERSDVSICWIGNGGGKELQQQPQSGFANHMDVEGRSEDTHVGLIPGQGLG